MATGHLQLFCGCQRSHLGREVECRAAGHLLHSADEARHEPVPDGVRDIHPFDRDAELATRGETGTRRALDSSVQVRIVHHDHRVLASELGRAVDQTLAALRCDPATRFGRAGEHHVVGDVEQRRADRGATAEHDLPEVLGNAGADREVSCEECRQRCLVVGLLHHRVTGQQRRDGVAGGKAQRIVPRRDDGDDALRMTDLANGRETRYDTRARSWSEQARSTAGVVATGDGDVRHLEVGVATGLAVLELDEVHQCFLVVEHQVVHAEEDLRALTHRTGRPHPLGLQCPVACCENIGWLALWKRRHSIAVERGVCGHG